MKGHLGFICPECGGILESYSDKHICKVCKRRYLVNNGIHVLLPSTLAQITVEEIKGYDDDLFGRRWCRRGTTDQEILFHKKPDMKDFEENVLKRIQFTGKVLEVGGGLGWASSMVKLKSNCVVYLSDVSVSALRRSMTISNSIGAKPDVLVALDIQRCPFSDDFFDIIFCSSVLHHIPNLTDGLSEIHRILGPEGIFIAIREPVGSILVKSIYKKGYHLYFQTSSKYAMQEEIYSLKEWKGFFHKAGFDSVHYETCRDPRYKPQSKLHRAYYSITNIIPDSVILKNFMCEIHITAKK